MTDDLPITTTEHLHRAIAEVSFENSCLDMGWSWQTQPIFVPAPSLDTAPASSMILIEDIPFMRAWRIRCSFQRPERDSGQLGTGFGRWWIIDFGTTESALWKTMGLLAARTIVDHELLEAFKVRGKRPFDPHRRVQDLIATGAEGR